MLDELSLYQTSTPKSLSPGEIWFKALSSPRQETYQDLLQQEDSPGAKALYWLFLAGGFGGMAASLLQSVFNSNLFFGLTSSSNTGDLSSSAVLWSFLTAVLFAIGVPLITLINTALIYLPARMLGGKTSFDKLLYAFAIYQAPLGLLICFIGAIPTVGCITLPLMVYWLGLSVVSVQAASQLDTGKSILSSLAPFYMGGTLGMCALVFSLITNIEII